MDAAKKEEQLSVFGLGLGLFIPFIVMMHAVDHGLGFFSFVLAVVAILVILAKAVKWKLPYILVLGVILYKFFTGDYKHQPGLFSYVFLLIALASIAVTFINVRLLEPVYEKWMVAAHFIGNTISAAVLIILYYCVFGVAGLVLRLIRKDLLDRSLDKEAVSYWNRRTDEFDPKHFERQF